MLVYFVPNWNILRPYGIFLMAFGCFYGNLVHFLPFSHRIIWQPCNFQSAKQDRKLAEASEKVRSLQSEVKRARKMAKEAAAKDQVPVQPDTSFSILHIFVRKSYKHL
jgi:hypothetical protein